ncbi:MAG: hypothetical protein EOS70_28060 [Mesorhizobium sp.]|uniref:hypothetical protein n=1 Tax=Mesorhizobium sp. TaxID=1871066 RepID=UPI000FE515D9|nr:hypothetical protein [Mesorhizobium sp.]RWC28168.1 MAG: hypothetical protein EOS70_28060 [Mesorhizobium sp.]
MYISMRLWAAVSSFFLLLVSTEVVCQVLGYKEQVLAIPDPLTGFRLAPSQDVFTRRGEVFVNRWSMRSPDFPYSKRPGERRILVLGDSVPMAGGVAQLEIATEILAKQLSATVGNISTGGWAPGNILAYVREYGWFEADTVVLVFNSEDVDAVMTYPPKFGPAVYQTRPISAGLAMFRTEVLGRIHNRFLYVAPAKTGAGAKDIAELIDMAVNSVPNVIVAFHPTKIENETGDRAPPSISNAAAKVGATFLQLHYGSNAYKDRIHLNAVGQRELADQIGDTISMPPALKSLSLGLVRQPR